jgi:hypothetical protein
MQVPAQADQRRALSNEPACPAESIERLIAELKNRLPPVKPSILQEIDLHRLRGEIELRFPPTLPQHIMKEIRSKLLNAFFNCQSAFLFFPNESILPNRTMRAIQNTSDFSPHPCYNLRDSNAGINPNP